MKKYINSMYVARSGGRRRRSWIFIFWHIIPHSPAQATRSRKPPSNRLSSSLSWLSAKRTNAEGKWAMESEDYKRIFSVRLRGCCKVIHTHMHINTYINTYEYVCMLSGKCLEKTVLNCVLSYLVGSHSVKLAEAGSTYSHTYICMYVHLLRCRCLYQKL